MSAATDRNEQHRWSYMTHAQLLRRLATMTNKEKIQSFIEQASSTSNPRLFEAGCDRMVETHGVCDRRSLPVGSLQSGRPLRLSSLPQTISIPTEDILSLEELTLRRLARKDAHKLIDDRIKRKTRAKSKPMRRKIRT